jgi:hypothetical protein
MDVTIYGWSTKALQAVAWSCWTIIWCIASPTPPGRAARLARPKIQEASAAIGRLVRS